MFPIPSSLKRLRTHETGDSPEFPQSSSKRMKLNQDSIDQDKIDQNCSYMHHDHHPQHYQEQSHSQPCQPSSKRIKLNQDSNDQNCSYMQHGYHPQRYQEHGYVQSHYPSLGQEQPAMTATLPYSSSDGSIPSLATRGSTTPPPEPIADGYAAINAYQHMNSYLGQLHLLRRLQRSQEPQHQQRRHNLEDTPRTSNKRQYCHHVTNVHQHQHFQQGSQEQALSSAPFAYLPVDAPQPTHHPLPTYSTITPSSSWGNIQPDSGHVTHPTSDEPTSRRQNKKVSLRSHSNLY